VIRRKASEDLRAISRRTISQ